MTQPETVPCVICRWRQPYNGYVCGPCRMRLGHQLREITIIYPVLPAALAEHPDAVVDLTLPARGGASTNTVYDPDHLQTGDLPVAARLDSWVIDFAEHLGLISALPVPTVFRLGKWLDQHREWACDSHPAVDEFAREIRQILADVRRALSRDDSPTRYEALCPYCHTKTLQRQPGGDWIECSGHDGCGRLWTEDEYGLLAHAAIAEEDLLTTAEAALLIKVDQAVIRKWDQRGRISPVQRDERGWPLYAAGDIRRLARPGTVVAS